MGVGVYFPHLLNFWERINFVDVVYFRGGTRLFISTFIHSLRRPLFKGFSRVTHHQRYMLSWPYWKTAIARLHFTNDSKDDTQIIFCNYITSKVSLPHLVLSI
jgi:hypothetical protein